MARPQRIEGCNYLGSQRYFVTFSTFLRQRAFVDERVALTTTLQIRRTAREQCFDILAYCLMPDHAYLLVEGKSAGADFRHFMKCAKQRTGQIYARQYKRRLWQAGYYERILRRDTDVREVARYIVWNPVRAGLVLTPDAYPHVGSDVLRIDDLVRA
jgi:REP element-mobilizing transposase RayT